jgi:membrane protein YdbS with pleckstrin-like domain
MPDPVSDDVARNRFFVINFTRLAGVVAVFVAMLILADAIAGSYTLGYILLGLGLFDIFVIPQFLARRWRTPPE